MATLLELDDLVSQIQSNPLSRRLRMALRIYAAGKVRDAGASATVKAWAKETLLNTDTALTQMMPDFATLAVSVQPPFSTITDAQITTAVATIAPTYHGS